MERKDFRVKMEDLPMLFELANADTEWVARLTEEEKQELVGKMKRQIRVHFSRKQPWRFSAVGNIKKTHYDSQGVLRYGTKAYSGGTKVYLCGKFWNVESPTVTVIGLNRCKRYAVNDVPVELIENVRCKRVYRPAILEIMNDWEFADCWWVDTEEERTSVERFLEKFGKRNTACGEAAGS